MAVNLRSALPPTFVDYPRLVDHLRRSTIVDSRLGPTREVLGGTFVLSLGTMVERRGFSVRLAMAELLLVLAGRHDVSVIAEAAPKADLSLFTEAMSYGPRIVDQLWEVCETLRTDPETRRAVLHLSNEPVRETCSDRLTCTNSVQFLIRDGVLHCVVSMRSWDVVLGLPYDVVVFGGLASTVARLVGVTPGQLMVTAGSMHAYQKDLDDHRSSPKEVHGRRTIVVAPWFSATSWDEVQATADKYLVPGFVAGWHNGVPSMFDVNFSVDEESGPLGGSRPTVDAVQSYKDERFGIIGGGP